MSALPVPPPPLGIDPMAILSAFFLHVGARNIQFDFTAAQKRLMASPITRMVVLFAMFYVSTRSLLWSITLVLLYFLLISMLLNENHPLNVFSRSWLRNEGFANIEKEHADMSPFDIYRENLKRLS